MTGAADIESHQLVEYYYKSLVLRDPNMPEFLYEPICR
jgi:hypothetical protein